MHKYTWRVEVYDDDLSEYALRMHILIVDGEETDWSIRKVGTDGWEIICSDDDSGVEVYAEANDWRKVRKEAIAMYEERK